MLCERPKVGRILEPKKYLQNLTENNANVVLGIRIENYSHLKLEYLSHHPNSHNQMGNESKTITDINPFSEYLFVILDSSQSIHGSISWKVMLDPEKSESDRLVLTYNEPYK